MRILVSFGVALLLFLTPMGLHGEDPSRCKVTLLRDRQFFHTLQHHLAGATDQIVMGMFLFKTSGYFSNRADIILEALIAAKKRGVDVRVLLEKTDRSHDSLDRQNMATSKKLRQHSVNVVFDSPETTTHTKVIVIDKRFVFLGSHNLTHSALFYNHELSVMIDDPDLAQDVIQYLKKLET